MMVFSMTLKKKKTLYSHLMTRMAKYSRSAGQDVRRAIKKQKAGTLKMGKSKKKVTSRQQAIAIGLSEARKKGKKVPKKSF